MKIQSVDEKFDETAAGGTAAFDNVDAKDGVDAPRQAEIGRMQQKAAMKKLKTLLWQ